MEGLYVKKEVIERDREEYRRKWMWLRHLQD